MNKNKMVKKLLKLKTKHNELLVISLSDKKLKKYKNRYDFLIAVPFLLCVIHFNIVAPLITNVAPVVKGLIGTVLILSNVVFPMCYINYKEKCEVRLKEKINRLSEKINAYEKSLNTTKKNLGITLETKEKTWEDLMYTEEEIKHYIPESPAPFNPETIFGTNENVETQTDNLHQEISGPRLVKKRIPPKNNNN